MKRKSILYPLSLLLIMGLLFSNCNKDDDNGDVSSMTATIDGASFSASDFSFNIISDTITSVIGWSGNEYLGFNLMNATTTGTYDVSLSSPNTATYSNDGQTSFYVSRQGRVEVTENNNSRIAGSFECIVVKASSSDTILIDNGLFDVSKSE
jgi:carbohydrate-selective porin OprB